jgi:hypothetical protein
MKPQMPAIQLFSFTIIFITNCLLMGCYPNSSEQGGVHHTETDARIEKLKKEKEAQYAKEAKQRQIASEAEEEAYNAELETENKKREDGRTPKFHTAQNVREFTEIEYDEFRKETSVRGPGIDMDKDTNYWLRANFDKDNTYIFELVVNHFRFDEIADFYEAYDSTGKRLGFMWIGSESNVETVSISIPYQTLENSDPHGLTIKIIGNRQDLVVPVAPHYMSGFLGKIAETGLMKTSTERPHKNL